MVCKPLKEFSPFLPEPLPLLWAGCFYDMMASPAQAGIFPGSVSKMIGLPLCIAPAPCKV